MIKKIAVIGTGVIGTGWIIRCLAHNKKVIVFDKDLKLEKKFDESLELAQCLRDKGLNIPDPTQDDPKLNLSEAGEDREIIKEYLEECEPERTASRTDK